MLEATLQSPRILNSGAQTAYDNTSHSHFQFGEALEAEPNLTMITRAQTLEITENAVRVEITTGGGPGFAPPGMPAPKEPPEPERKEIREIPCDNVVFSAGRRPLVDRCMEFAGLTPKFFIVGDANMLSGDPVQRHPGEVSKPSEDSTPHEIRHEVLTACAAARLI